VQPPPLRSEQLHFAVAVRATDFGDGEARVVAVEQRPDPFQEPGDRVVALVVAVQLIVERAGARDAVVIGRGRIVAEGGIKHHEVDRVDPETIDAALQPEAGDIEERLLHRRVVPVDLRLLLQEIVHVILAPARVPGPCRAAEHRLPVVGGRTVRLGIVPDVPVGIGVVAALAALLEPGMPVAGMRPDLVDDHLQAERVRPRDERVEIRERAEDRVDVAIVGNVIAEVGHRRPEEGRQPDRLDAQAGDMIEMRRDAREIPDSIAIRVGEAARIDLVNGRTAPPRPLLARLHTAHRDAFIAQTA
jgi:hypothetical protein